LFGVLGETRKVGKASRIATTRAIPYQWLPLIIRLLSETEVARCTSGIILLEVLLKPGSH
jgi:hypothetical protein